MTFWAAFTDVIMEGVGQWWFWPAVIIQTTAILLGVMAFKWFLTTKPVSHAEVAQKRKLRESLTTK